MKALSLVVLAMLSCSLYGAMGSSISVPVREHLKYTFGNHKNHPVQKREEQQYLRSLAPMSEGELRNRLIAQGYEVRRIELRDIVSELVYQADVIHASKQHLRVYADPGSGTILKTEKIQ